MEIEPELEADGQTAEAADRGKSPAWRWPMLLALAFGAVLLILDAGVQPVSLGEPVALRWVRKAAEHPLRSVLAAAMCLFGVWPGRAGTTDRRPTAPEISTRG